MPPGKEREIECSMNQRIFSRTLFHIALAVCGFFYMYPFLWMLSASVKTRTEFFGSGLRLLPQRIVWQNYVEAWQTAKFGIYFKNSVFVTITATLIVVFLTSMAGYALSRSHFPGRKLIIGTILITMFLPKGYTIIPIFEFVKNLRLLNTLWAVILVNAATEMVFGTFLFIGYFRTLPRELEEAATIDGASFPHLYWRIAIPLAKPMLGTVALFEFIDAWNSFFIPLVFTLGMPDLRTVTVGMYAFMGQHSTNWTAMCAAATISLLPTMILFFVMQRLFVKGVTGAIRGR
jgi:ABC-type glycerol-3-phosphate transport system permease component